jgi:hypothetical protein
MRASRSELESSSAPAWPMHTAVISECVRRNHQAAEAALSLKHGRYSGGLGLK